MFKKKYPGVHLEPEQLMIQDGNIISTGAVTALKKTRTQRRYVYGRS